MADKKVAFIISGAAAFIAQELALIKTLMEGLSPNGEKIRPTIVAGTSSGSLSTIVVNGIAQAQAGKGDLTWDIVEQDILFPLNNDDVFNSGFFATITAIYDALKLGFVLNTNPFKKTLNGILKDYFGYEKMADLFLPTFISAVNRDTALTRRFGSRNDSDKDFELLQVLLASTAIPVVFPIREVDGAGRFVDGGTGTDNIPSEALVPDAPYDEVYVITYKHNIPTSAKELSAEQEHNLAACMKVRHTNCTGKKSLPILANATFALDVQSSSILPFQVFRAMTLAKSRDKAFFYMPRFDKEFGFLNFDVMEEQFNLTIEWAKKNDPQPITEFLNEINFPVKP